MTIFRSNRWGVAAACLVLGFFVLAGGLVYRALPEPSPPRSRDDELAGEFEYPASNLPPVTPADGAGLADDEPVIGIRVSGTVRAYPLALLAGLETHVINDVVAGTPVTVTYCDRKDCVRAFTGDGSRPLDVRIGGYERGLLLLVGGRRYRQDTGAPVQPGAAGSLPYWTVEFVRTTWKKWRKAHPETEVVTTLQGDDGIGS